MNNRSQFAIVRYTMKLNNLKLHAHDLREGKRSAISSLVNAIGSEEIDAIIAYYENKIEELKKLSVPQISDVRCDYTGGGIWVYTAKYGPAWLIGTLDTYINAYDEYVDTNSEEASDYDYEAHCVDKYLVMPTWGDILDSLCALDDGCYSDYEHAIRRLRSTPCNDDDDGESAGEDGDNK